MDYLAVKFIYFNLAFVFTPEDFKWDFNDETKEVWFNDPGNPCPLLVWSEQRGHTTERCEMLFDIFLAILNGQRIVNIRGLVIDLLNVTSDKVTRKTIDECFTVFTRQQILQNRNLATDYKVYRGEGRI